MVGTTIAELAHFLGSVVHLPANATSLVCPPSALFLLSPSAVHGLACGGCHPLSVSKWVQPLFASADWLDHSL